MRKTNQLHAAVVELVPWKALKSNTAPCRTGIPVTRMARVVCSTLLPSGQMRGADSKISWTQVETGSAITWKYPSVILQGDNSFGEFYSWLW